MADNRLAALVAPFAWYGDERIREWRRQMRANTGAEPNFADQSYDYGGAIEAGARPEFYPPDNSYHWPSGNGQRSFKAASHPTAWMEDFMRASGGVDPHDATTQTLRDNPGAKAVMNNALLRVLLGFR